MDDETSIPISALQHYIYCPRQWALIHLEQIWTENVHTAQGRLLHQRADAPSRGLRHGVRTVTAMNLRHEGLGLVGIADVVELHEDEEGRSIPFPIEYKRGRPKSHRADEVQLCAQAMCLEAMMCVPVPEGAIFYGQTRRRFNVCFDPPLRDLTKSIITSIRTLMDQARTPHADYEPKKCTNCSLIDDCQPTLFSGKLSVSEWLSNQLAKDAS